ncbi:MAG: DUF5691 domain-containing protein [Azoarcus sp.]|jgi:hypothetical protein|nr:DUF5691 domain-containing protein [Azoarcus sp.]
MSDPLAGACSAIRDCWIGGGNAVPLAPPDWQALIAAPTPEESERILVALTGQALEVAFRPALPKDTIRAATLPRLAKPILPNPLRALFRHALASVSGNSGTVLRLLERRGFCAHPLDWFPAASTDAPDLYAPWQDWARSSGTAANDGADELDADTWDDFQPARRRALLKTLRRQNPVRARELIAAKAGQETAEKRLALTEILTIGLDSGDIPYLRSLATDRSGKLKLLAARLLARLKQKSETTPQEELAELAGFLTVGSKGIFRRKPTVAPNPLQPRVQTRRQELFEQSALPDIAAALGLTEAELIDGWQFHQKNMTPDTAFVKMVLETAADEFIPLLVNRLLEEDQPTLAALLAPRLDADEQARIVKAILANPSTPFCDLAQFGHGDLAGPDDILSSPVYRALKTGIREQHSLPILNALAPIATAGAARAVLDDLSSSSGIFPVDPALAFLRLNQELTPAASARI